MKFYSDNYESLLIHEHTNTHDWTWTNMVSSKVPEIVRLLKQYNETTILDYGSGESHFKNKLEELYPNEYNVIEYDPGIKSKSNYPEPCNFIICVDVLEHIEPEFIINVLDDLERLILKFGFFTISLVPAGLHLKDGRNAHLCIKSYDWWLDEFSKRFNIVKETHSTVHIKLYVLKRN